MIKLWGRNTSSNVMKAIWLLEELGLEYERVDVGGSFGGTDTEHYRAMNLLGLVPALEDGDFTLFESNAILRCTSATRMRRRRRSIRRRRVHARRSRRGWISSRPR